MNALWDSLVSGTFNNITTGATYSAVMSAQAHVIGLLGLIASLLLTQTLAANYGLDPRPYMLGWSARAIFCLYNTYISTFNVDSFEDWATDMSNDSFENIILSIGNANSYTAFCALIYKVFGRNPLLLQVINICFWALILHCVPKIAALFGTPRAGRPALWMCALLPSGVFYSTVILRESACTIGVVYGFYYWLRATRRFSVVDYIRCAVCFCLAAAIHYGVVSLLIALVMISLFSVRKETTMNAGKKIWFICSVGGFSVLLALGLFRYGLMESLAPQFAQGNLSIASVGGVETEYLDAGRTDYMRGLRSDSAVGLSWTAPIRFFLFLFSPLPWMLRKVIDLIAFADAVAFGWSLVVIFLARKWVVHEKQMLGVLICCTVGLFVFAMGTLNFGTAVRHRAKFLPVIVTLAYSAREIRLMREQRRRWVAPGLVHPHGLKRASVGRR